MERNKRCKTDTPSRGQRRVPSTELSRGRAKVKGRRGGPPDVEVYVVTPSPRERHSRGEIYPGRD